MDDDVTEGCGFSWDHTLELLSEGAGGRTYVCRECGAEIIEEDDGEEVPY